MEERIVSLEVINLAKQRGLKQTDRLGYVSENGKVIKSYSTVTQSSLIKWLREEHTIHVEPFSYTESTAPMYTCAVVKGFKLKGTVYTEKKPVWEDVVEDGLKLALTNDNLFKNE